MNTPSTFNIQPKILISSESHKTKTKNEKKNKKNSPLNGQNQLLLPLSGGPTNINFVSFFGNFL